MHTILIASSHILSAAGNTRRAHHIKTLDILISIKAIIPTAQPSAIFEMKYELHNA
jgi:hypothetical protein